MAYAVAPVNDQVHVLARWDETWNSYNNCYLVSGRGRLVLIDCGKADHASELVAALAELGLRPADITVLLATHGHRDHIGAWALFTQAEMYLHPADRALLGDEALTRFGHALPDDGGVLDFDCIHLGHHTPGSVALFHRETGTLFAGDHLCFFGKQLPAGGLVSPAPELRELSRQFVSGWALHPENRSAHRFEEFRRGLDLLARFPGRSFCTGHGGVLTGMVPEFLRELGALDSDANGGESG